MKIFIITLMFVALSVISCAGAAGQTSSKKEISAPPVAGQVKVPTQKAALLRQAGEQIQQRQREIEMLQVHARNVLLEAALELRLTKEQFEQMELATDAEGNLVLKPKAVVGSESQRTPTTAQSPK